MADFRSLNDSVFESEEFKMMQPIQQSIVLYAMLGGRSHKASISGMYPISTGSFTHLPKKDVIEQLGGKAKELQELFPLDIEEVQDQLGHDDFEIKLSKNKKKRTGKLVASFNDWIDYDPEKDIIYCKKLYEYSGRLYLKTDKAKVQALHREFNGKNAHLFPERWWGELMNTHYDEFKKAWYEFSKDNVKDDKASPYQKTFDRLFFLKEKYQDLPKNFIKKPIFAEQINGNTDSIFR